MNWDKYFHNICESIASKSPCLSRQIGAILVRDNSIISTGYNGPARKVPHCGIERVKYDKNIRETLENNLLCENFDLTSTCPRRILQFASGEGMEWCPAQHAEENCISNAARNGVSTLHTTLYMNSVIPCKNCLSTLINAGVFEIVVDSTEQYDRYSKFIIDHSNLYIRTFEYD